METTSIQRHDPAESMEGPLPPGQIILFEQYRLLRRTWWWVLILALIVSAGVWYYVNNHVTPEFRATAVSVPPRKSGTPLDNLLGDFSSGLKSISISKLIGRKSSESGYTTFSILTSDAIKDSLIDAYDLYQVYEIPEGRRDLVYGALDGHLELENDLEGPIIVSIYDTDPERAANMANDLIRFTNSMLVELNRVETEPISQFIAGRYEELQKNHDEVAAKMREFMHRTNIYEPESQLTATATALIEARVHESTQRALVNMLEHMLGADDPAVTQQKALLKQYQREQKRLEAGRAGVGPSVSSLPEGLIEYAKLRQDYEVSAELMAIVEPMYQQTLFDEQRDIPQLLFVHEATPPAVKARPKPSLALLSAFFGTLLISYVIIAFTAFFRSFNRRYRVYRQSFIDNKSS
ncbi:MAG: hypothetical protein J4G05_00855 [Chlorobi bacterium]|nr:hypothetical protein [Chlorobiota bacterium]